MKKICILIMLIVSVVLVVLQIDDGEEMVISTFWPEEKCDNWGDPNLPILEFQPLGDSLTPQVLIGDGILNKRVVINSSDISHITDIHRRPDGNIVFIGIKGYVETNKAYELVGQQSFDSVVSDLDDRDIVRIVRTDLDRDGIEEFLALGAIYHPVTLYDKDGKVLWMRPGTWVHAIIADVQGDDDNEIILYNSSKESVQVLDIDGSTLSSVAAEGVMALRAVPDTVKGSANDTIYYSDLDLHTISQDYTVKPVGKSIDILGFVPHDVPLLNRGWGFYVPCTNLVAVLDQKGAIISKLHAPYSSMISSIIVESFCPLNDREPLVAILLNAKDGFSLLYIYSNQGGLAYQEIIKGDCTSMRIIQSSDKQTLLVGSKNKVLEYSLNI